MPSAVPVPRGPSRLILFGAEDLLRGTGCPVCRYVSEADDRFSGWFAVESHADPGMITRLGRSLGTCPVHTRGLLRQPGAGTRMTAVCRYLLRAALEYLTAGTSPQAPCPACAHGAEATLRAVDTLVTAGQHGDLREGAGLCLPHLRTALSRSGRRLGSRLARHEAGRLAGAGPDLAVLAGDGDADADLRARLRAALPAAPAAAGPEGGGVCPVCLTAAQAERGALAQAGGTGWCPAHLHDACSGPRRPAAALLAREAGQAAAWLAGRTAPASPRTVLRRFTGRAGAAGGPGCPACAAARAAGAQAAAALPDPGLPQVCLRHVLSLSPQDPRRAAAARMAARRTESVLRELDEAFGKRAWDRRHEPRGAEMTAWRRAAALIDGRVYGGGPAGPL
ncbi:MAG TPA: hypothetical protein VH480_25135 [Streptosporangiaceae bacterium]|jgi:hypothetical protein